MFSPSPCLFSFALITSFKEQFYILIKSNLSIYSLVDRAFGIVTKKSQPKLRSWTFYPMFFPKISTVLGFIFRSIMHFIKRLHLLLERERRAGGEGQAGSSLSVEA